MRTAAYFRHSQQICATPPNQRLQRSVHHLLIGVFAAVAIALAAIGLYGIIAYTVAQQRAEIGIRPAPGRAMVIVAAGLGLGLAGAVLVTHAMSTRLYGVGVYDPATFIATPLVLASTGLVAGYLLARRAA